MGLRGEEDFAAIRELLVSAAGPTDDAGKLFAPDGGAEVCGSGAGAWPLGGAPDGGAVGDGAALVLAESVRRTVTELPAPRSTSRKSWSVTSCARTMCGVMAKIISFSCLCLSSCAKKYFSIGTFKRPG